MKLTVASVPSLKLPAGKRDHIQFDSDIAGFGLRMRVGGKRVKRVWVFQDKLKNGRHRRISFGDYPAMDVPKAREQAEIFRGEVRLGGDPAGDKVESQTRAGETFEACMELYLERRRNDPKLRRSSYCEIERHLARNLKALHGLRIDKVDRRAIALELGKLVANGAVQANRTRSSLIAFLNWCAGEGFIDSNPAQLTNKTPEKARERVLSDAELRTIWHALRGGDFSDLIKLLMLTGQRAAEFGDLRWNEIDFDRAVVTLPPPRTKNGRWHTIPLSAPALSILKSRDPYPGRELVFGIGQGGFSGWAAPKRRLDERTQLPAWVIHDLRRACATGMAEIGVQPHVIEQVLNHQSGTKAGVAGVYNLSKYETSSSSLSRARKAVVRLWAT